MTEILSENFGLKEFFWYITITQVRFVHMYPEYPPPQVA